MPVMSYDETLAARVRAVLGTRPDVVEKKMFGGLCFMVNGKMCCGLTSTDFMVRVGPEAYEKALARKHARPMDFTGRPLVGMVYVAPDGLRTRAELTRWVALGVAFVLTNATSKKRSGKRRARRPLTRRE
jgi:TfoX/Sxy family transcriptional regulator of competence genes